MLFFKNSQVTTGALSQATQTISIESGHPVAWQPGSGLTKAGHLTIPFSSFPLPARNQYDRGDVGDGRLAEGKHKNCCRSALLRGVYLERALFNYITFLQLCHYVCPPLLDTSSIH